MNQITKKYSVRILNRDYTILTDESEEHVMRVAAYVDRIMQESVDQKLGASDVQKAAILVTLKIASRLFALEDACHRQEAAGRKLIDLIEQRMG